MREGHQSPVGLVLKKIITGLLEEQLEEKIIVAGWVVLFFF